MAVVAHLVEKELDPGDQVYDGIAAVVLAIDDAVDTTDALIQARAVTVLNAAGYNFPTGYFTKNTAIAATFSTAGDIVAVDGRNVYEAIA